MLFSSISCSKTGLMSNTYKMEFIGFIENKYKIHTILYFKFDSKEGVDEIKNKEVAMRVKILHVWKSMTTFKKEPYGQRVIIAQSAKKIVNHYLKNKVAYVIIDKYELLNDN
jgi:hypothetical protein